LLNAIYYLPIIILGFVRNEKYHYRMTSIENTPKTMITPLFILGILIVGFGLFPNIIFPLIDAAVNILLS